MKKFTLSMLLITSTAITGIHSSPTLALDIKKIVDACSDCHGKNGFSEDNSAPTIAGLSQTYFVETLADFANDKRPASTVKRDGKPDTDMKEVLEDLTTEKFNALAQYFEEKEFVRKPQKFVAANVKAGKRIHQKYCSKCHEDAGRSKDDDAGILAGQKRKYLENTFAQFIDGKRKMSKKMKKKMDRVEKKYGKEGFTKLVDYYTSQI